jgi:phosphatidylglycerol:prolipoprotein diacylglycerol transferase
MMAVAFLVAYLIATRRATKEGVKKEVIGNLWFVCLVSGIIGARGYFVIQHWREFKDNLAGVVAIWHGGLVWQGGMILAVAAGIAYLKYAKAPVWRAADVVSPAGMLGLAFGRVGCFLNGCCFGKVCEVTWVPWPLKLTFPPGSPAYVAHYGAHLQGHPHSPPVYATQLFSLVGAVIIFLVLNRYFKYKKRDGEVFSLMCVLYAADRFVIEFFREEPLFALGLTDDQVMNIIVFILALTAFLYLRKKA